MPFEERKKVNYDHPDSLETDLMIQHLEALKNGIAVDCPVYDYSMHNRSDKTIHIEPKKIILAEGILLLEDPRLRNMMDIKIYVEADADERILRRIVRDVKERGRDLDNIVEQYLTTVKPMHYLYVEPTRALADVVINSGMNDVAFDVVKIQDPADVRTKNQNQSRNSLPRELVLTILLPGYFVFYFILSFLINIASPNEKNRYLSFLQPLHKPP